MHEYILYMTFSAYCGLGPTQYNTSSYKKHNYNISQLHGK